MAKEIRSAFVRSQATLLGDAVGVLALIALLYLGLALPNLL